MRFTDALLDELARELQAHLSEVEAEARRILDDEGVNYTRSTRNGLYATAEADRRSFVVEGEVGSRGAAAWWANDGRGPGKAPPDAPIRAWLRDKRGVRPGRELDRATRRLQAKIARRGTRGSRFLDRAFDGAFPDLQPRLARAADRALDGASLL